MTLLEKLCVVAIVAILAVLLLATISKAYLYAKRMIVGVYAYHENQLDVYLNDRDSWLMFYSTNKPIKGDYIGNMAR